MSQFTFNLHELIQCFTSRKHSSSVLRESFSLAISPDVQDFIKAWSSATPFMVTSWFKTTSLGPIERGTSEWLVHQSFIAKYTEVLSWLSLYKTHKAIFHSYFKMLNIYMYIYIYMGMHIFILSSQSYTDGPGRLQRQTFHWCLTKENPHIAVWKLFFMYTYPYSNTIRVRKNINNYVISLESTNIAS